MTDESDTIEGSVTFKYWDNQHKAKEMFAKDLGMLQRQCPELNERGVSYDFHDQFLGHEMIDGERQYQIEIQVRIEGSSIGPADMKQAFDETMEDVTTYSSSFLY